MADEREWRDGLKVGDVVFCGRHMGRMCEVESATATQVRTLGRRFWRKTGLEVGRTGREAIYADRIIRPLPIQLEKYREGKESMDRATAIHESRRPALIAAVRSFVDGDLAGVGIDVLDRVAAAMKGA